MAKNEDSRMHKNETKFNDPFKKIWSPSRLLAPPRAEFYGAY
jgi:hypothetical protein